MKRIAKESRRRIGIGVDADDAAFEAEVADGIPKSLHQADLGPD